MRSGRALPTTALHGPTSRTHITVDRTAIEAYLGFISPWRVPPPLLAASGPRRQLLFRRPQGRETEHPSIVPASDPSSWTVPLVSIDQGHLISGPSTGVLTNRELAFRAVAALGADRHVPERPTRDAPRTGSS